MGTHGDRYRQAAQIRACLVQVEDELDEWDSIELDVLRSRLAMATERIGRELRTRGVRR